MGSLVEVSLNSRELLFKLFWFYIQLNPDNSASSKHICREASADDFITHAWCTLYLHEYWWIINLTHCEKISLFKVNYRTHCIDIFVAFHYFFCMYSLWFCRSYHWIMLSISFFVQNWFDRDIDNVYEYALKFIFKGEQHIFSLIACLNFVTYTMIRIFFFG